MPGAVQEEESEVRSNVQDLNDRLNHIRSSPNLQSQKHSSVILSAVEETLKEQKSDFTPTAYFAALLSLLNQYVSSTNGLTNKETATAIVYLLDLVTSHVPAPLLRSKFSHILIALAPSLSHPEADGPFLRSAIGCLVSLLLVQNSQAWNLPQTEVGPRKALAGLLSLASDHRPKVRKRALAGLATVLQHPPPSPSLDHPAADMCAETALQPFQTAADTLNHNPKQISRLNSLSTESELIRGMQLAKTIASSCGGWPSRSLEPLCQVLLSIARSKSEFLTISSFDVFEVVFSGMANEQSRDKLPHLLEAVTELQPPRNDTQLYPPWLAIISRGYDVFAQVDPVEAWRKVLPLFKSIAEALASPAYNIRVSASECLISLLVNCVQTKMLLALGSHNDGAINEFGAVIAGLLNIKYQSAWMEVFNVLGAAFDAFKSYSLPPLAPVIRTVGELRDQDSFAGKSEADLLLSKAIRAVRAEDFLSILPLNLINPASGEQGRAWIIPLLRDSVRNDHLSHFKKELLPLSEQLYQKVLNQQTGSKTMETKIFETLIQQIWDALPGYCDLPVDLTSSFDQQFAEMLCNLLYQKPEMRTTICRSLQNLVESNKVVAAEDADSLDHVLRQVSPESAQKNVQYLALFGPNLLAVLFNVYTQTTAQQRGAILECIDSYLSITDPVEISNTFERVATMLDASMKELSMSDKPSKQVPKDDNKTEVLLALTDIVVTIATYLPRQSFQTLFVLASAMISQKQNAQLQKKAYKLIPRLAQSETGKTALKERHSELRQMLLENTENVLVAARRDRLKTLSQLITELPLEDYHFIAMVLPEIILGTKDTGERSRYAAFDLLMLIGEKMQAGGTIDNSKLSTSDASASNADGQATASIEEYMTMLSAGLAGTTPHMISATVTAMTRVFYAYHSSLSESTTSEILSTMDLFLRSPSREVVRSVLGFVKVSVLSLPIPFMLPRLQTLIPNLMPWSHEHKGHFKAKVKNILERVIRRFGVEVVERYCPAEDRRLIANIRKTRDRRKRGKAAAGEEDADVAAGPSPRAEGEAGPRYNNEFDEAIYGSDSDMDSANEGADGMDSDDASAVHLRNKGNGSVGGRRKKNQATTYIREDSEEPLDLLDRKALGNISSGRPTRLRDVERKRHAGKAKTDEDGKFVFGDQADDDEDMIDTEGDLEKGINAYVEAIRGKDAARRGQRGRLKFSNKREKGQDMDDFGDEDDDKQDSRRATAGRGGRGRSHGRRGSFSGRGQISPRGGGRGGSGMQPRRGGRGGGASPRGGAGRVQKRKMFRGQRKF